MTYDAALQYIATTLRFGSKPGLDRIKNLLDLIGNPQDSLKFIHIAGTNGKGSVSKAVSAALTKSGFKTGLFISPYVIEFCERIQINGEYISHEELAEEVETIKPFAEELSEHPTEFELITALAFDYFKKKKCDIIVLEVGLGGRFDATNIIKNPLASVITSISYDHMDFLGDTLPEIAFEKCGIIKNDGVTVTSPQQKPEVLEVIMKSCAQRNNTLVVPNISSVKIQNEGIDGTDIKYGEIPIHIPLAGRHQILNFLTAFETVKALLRRGINIQDKAIIDGMAEVKFPARMEILNRQPLVLLDGAHNFAGAAALRDSITRFIKEKPVLIIGMLKDKEYEKSISLLAPLAKAVVAVKPESPRALHQNELKDIISKYCKNSAGCENYSGAFKKAIEYSGGAPIVICGSLYLAGSMRKTVKEVFKTTKAIPHNFKCTDV
ncbi:MAG TPA: folylpolyglutamate synthase/dihydrofolate synthase family protein [Ruminiclostridium sp.]|nr:folylpolyglutamate synthase/dihydrofolate synthase family protein [Ruminiclostridium sp.]